MNRVSLFTNGVKKTTAAVLPLIFIASPVVSVNAQFQGFTGGTSQSGTSGLGQAVGNVSIDIGNSLIDGVDTGINDAVSGIQTGNVITDGIAQGAAGAIGGAVGGFVACQVGGAIGGGLGLAGAASGLVVPVNDALVTKSTVAQEVKDCTLDGLAFALKEGIIKGLISGLIEYVNNGFDGGPAYVTDEDAYFQNQADQLFEQYLENPNNFSTVCSAWEADVRLALASQYSTNTGGRRVTQLSGTGTGTTQPVSSGPTTCPLDNGGYATGETDQDYWGTFLQQTTNTQGNAVTSYFNIQETIVASIQKEATKKINEIQRNEGFLNVTYCDDNSATYNNIDSSNQVQINNQNCKVTTPGSVINEQLNQALGSDGRRLEAADELNELFSALVGQLVKAAFSGLGLLGTTERNGTSASLTDQYSDSVNPAVAAGSRDVLLDLMDDYETGINEFISIKQDSITFLANARIAAEGVYLCYGSKYDTWVRLGTNDIIAPDDLASVPESDRERATFIYTQTIGTGGGEGGDQTTLTAYLSPTQSGQKVTDYQETLSEIGDYIAQTQLEIDTAIVNRDEAVLLRSWLGDINDNQEPLAAALANSNILALIAETFAQVDTSNLPIISVPLDDGTLVDIPQELSEQQLLEVFAIASEELAQFDGNAAINQRRLIEISTTDLIEGTQEVVGGPRIGGFTRDLEQCNLFTRIQAPFVAEPDAGGGSDR